MDQSDQFQAIFPNETLLQIDVTGSAPVLSRNDVVSIDYKLQVETTFLVYYFEKP